MRRDAHPSLIWIRARASSSSLFSPAISFQWFRFLCRRLPSSSSSSSPPLFFASADCANLSFVDVVVKSAWCLLSPPSFFCFLSASFEPDDKVLFQNATSSGLVVVVVDSSIVGWGAATTFNSLSSKNLSSFFSPPPPPPPPPAFFPDVIVFISVLGRNRGRLLSSSISWRSLRETEARSSGLDAEPGVRSALLAAAAAAGITASR